MQIAEKAMGMCNPVTRPLLRPAAAVVCALFGIAGTGFVEAAASPVGVLEAGTCYARIYSVAHLANHPRQRVVKMWLEQDPAYASQDGRLVLRFGFSLRDGRSYEAFAACAGDARCAVEADGGRFTLSSRGEKVLMSVDGYLAVEGRDFSPNLAESDDRAFLLAPSARSQCN